MSLQTIRHIVKRIVPVLTVLFFVVLAVDEWQDAARAMQDMTIETCAEVEPYDFEWDEGQVQHLTDLSPVSPKGRSSLSLGEGWGEVSRTLFISDKQRLGLVRRYAPRKAILCHNYART